MNAQSRRDRNRASAVPLMILALTLAWHLPLCAQEHASDAPDGPTDVRNKPQHKAIENADVIAMAQNHFDDDSMLSVIELNETNFDVSADGLIALKKVGVNDRVIGAMLEATRHKLNPATSTPPAEAAAAYAGTHAATPPYAGMPAMDPQMAASMQAAMARVQSMGYGGMSSMSPGPTPHVFLIDAAGKTELAVSSAQRAVSKFKSGGPNQGAMMLSSLASEALSFGAMGAGPAGMMAMSGMSMFSGLLPGMHASAPSINYAWGLAGTHSGRILSSMTPSFELSYKDIPGVDPDAFEPTLVRLVLTKDNYRLVGATKQKLGSEMGMGAGMEAGEWIAQDKVPVRLQKKERGVYAVQLDKSLQPGEYGVVLRAVKGYKAQPSGFGGAEQLTSAVWDFSVPGTIVEAPKKNK